LRDDLPRADVVGMAVVGPHRENDLWFAEADCSDDLHLLIAAGTHAAVSEVELIAKTRP
jgi:hypothetical protein